MDKWIQLQSSDGVNNLFPVSKMDLLWENETPTSSFAAQDIAVDLSKYTRIYITMKLVNTSSDTNYMDYIVLKDQRRLLWSNATFIYIRHITCSDTKVNVEAGYKVTTYNGSLTQDNTVMIPYKVYGLA